MSKEIVKDPAQAIVKNPVFTPRIITKMVFISGPLSKGDPEKNVNAAKEACMELVLQGFAPFCPHLSWYIDKENKYYDWWLNVDLHILKKCDVMLRLSGESHGAEVEENYAKIWGIPVFYDIDSLVKYFKEQK